MSIAPLRHASVRTTTGCHDSCGTTKQARALHPDRVTLVRRAFRLEYLTIAWMVIEAAVAIWSGAAAGSISLIAFGIDSLIEIASAGVLIWRLRIELRNGQVFAEAAERAASRIAGTLLFALTAYVVASAAWKFSTQTGQTFSLPGLVVAALAMPLMYLLARRKRAVADALGSRALRADAMEAITCGWLSLVVVAGLLLEALTGAWWVDAATSLGIVWFLVKEGREAWSNEDCCRG